MMSQELEVLTFEVAGIQFGVRSSYVLEVLRAVALSRIPQAPAAIEGILNLRGHILPVLDVRRMLEFEAAPMDHTDHLLVLQASNRRVVIRVDRAIGLLSLSVDEPAPTSGSEPRRLVELVAKTSNGLVRVIDPARLLSEPQIETLVHDLALSAATEFTS